MGICLHDHLLAREKSVGDELAGSDGNWRVGHGCGVGSVDERDTRNRGRMKDRGRGR
jgi:hypothetical protein